MPSYDGHHDDGLDRCTLCDDTLDEVSCTGYALFLKPDDLTEWPRLRLRC
jgi:hypothetical protein